MPRSVPRPRVAEIDDLEAIARLEAASYPADEAASESVLRRRLEAASRYFLVLEMSGTIVGFICATRAAEPTLTHESMRAHVPGGASLCIHSVVVDARHRRQGLGAHLVRALVEETRADPRGVDRIVLIAKAHLVEFYRLAGFELVGRSSVVHGKDDWYELSLRVAPAP